MFGLQGNDILSAGDGDDELYGNEGDDTVEGDNGNDLLYGGAGNDTLRGSSGNDVLDGGPGDDSLFGQGNNDIYVFEIGSGHDTILDYSRSTTERVRFGAGIAVEGIRRSKSGLDLLLEFSSGDSLRIESWYNDFVNGRYVLDEFEFADGTVLSPSELTKATPLIGTSADDTLVAGSEADLLQGLAGNDMLSGGGGNDELYGGEGEDTLEGDNGNDLLYGGTGNDLLRGGTGSDTLVGGPGNDSLFGQGDSDIYVFEIGSGHDTILDYSRSTTERVRFGSGIAVEDFSHSQNGSDLLLELPGGDSLRMQSWYVSSGYYLLDEFEFADGAVLSRAEFLAALP